METKDRQQQRSTTRWSAQDIELQTYCQSLTIKIRVLNKDGKNHFYRESFMM